MTKMKNIFWNTTSFICKWLQILSLLKYQYKELTPVILQDYNPY